jgi:hypothetical protein
MARRQDTRGRGLARDLALFLAAMVAGAGIGAALTAQDQQLRWVVVAAHDIPAGTFVTGDHLTTRLNWVHPEERGLARDPKELIGRVATSGAFAGHWLRETDVTLAALPEPPVPATAAEPPAEASALARIEPAAPPAGGRARLEARLAATPEPAAIRLASGTADLGLAAGPEAILERLRAREQHIAATGGDTPFAGPLGATLTAGNPAAPSPLAALTNGAALR